MAAFDIETALKNLADIVEAADGVIRSEIGLRKQVTGEDLFASIFMRRLVNPQATLDASIEVWTVTVRLFKRALNEGATAVEIELGKAVVSLMAGLAADLNLGGTIRNLDWAGQYGPAVGADWDFDEEGLYRICDIAVPMIVDDNVTHTL